MKPAVKVGLIVLALLVCLAGPVHGYFILRVGDDFDQPELYRPDADGLMPDPDHHPLPVEFVISDKGTPDTSGEFKAFSASLATWNAADGSAIELKNGGQVSLDGSYAGANRGKDGLNGVEWIESDWFLGNAILAYTNITQDAATGRIIEADILLNGQDFKWSVLDGSKDHPDKPVGDVQDIITHELGHALGLGHTQVKEATMSGSGTLGDTHRRTLHVDDRRGLRYLYPETDADYPPPSIWGIRAGACTTDCAMSFCMGGNPGYRKYIEVLDGSGPLDYCLYGMGILAGAEPEVFSGDAALGPAYVSDSVVISSNLASAELDVNALATGAYEPAIINPEDQVGDLFQGILLNAPGNRLPVAVAAASAPEVKAGGTVILYGNASHDDDGQELTYQWLALEYPEGGAPPIDDDQAVNTEVMLPGPGVYIFALVVNDGIVEGLAHTAEVIALPKKKGGGGGGACEGICCGMSVEHAAGDDVSGYFVLISLPLVIVIVLRRLWRKSEKTS